MACVYVYVILLTFLGPEYLGRDFHVENDDDMRAAANPDAIAVRGGHHHHEEERRSGSGQGSDEVAEEKVVEARVG